MKLQFKTQAYQTQAVEAVLDCFDGQPMAGSLSYKMDAGSARAGEYQGRRFDETVGFRNAELELDEQQLLENIRAVQLRQHLPRSERLDAFQSLKKGAFVADGAYTRKALANCRYQLDVEMETGTGKTYCYLKSIFALKARYGWSKFIVVVPSVAIREGVYKTLQITAEHFHEQFRERAHFFIYDSRRLDQLELFASNAGISVMVINAQAFNARSQDARRIYERLDAFQSRKPIDVISASRPILILDEPQKMEGDKTLASLKEFQPLFCHSQEPPQFDPSARRFGRLQPKAGEEDRRAWHSGARLIWHWWLFVFGEYRCIVAGASGAGGAGDGLRVEGQAGNPPAAPRR